MTNGDTGPETWRRRPGCKAKLRGISPWACNVVEQICEKERANPNLGVADSYANGAIRLLERLAPQCLECLEKRRKSESA